ncbi:hypothetical protein PPYR_02498 [Photinus pyralis]|uniref:Uncharacterized protein n=1 Tax=Photinus pyralis TaxID=7054 RepID=A0A1Y1LFJ0_PHOPY|nr:uncharacterized protein LOC116159673 [Photinus pyralis]KAB0805528.1 hypothetical protein PPYR_02498 [Photinus pyralis]
MKLLILFALLSSSFASWKFDMDPEILHDWLGMMQPYTEQCHKETDVDKEIVYNAFMKMDLPEDYKEFNCFAKCMYTRLGFYYPETGKFDRELMVKRIKGMTKHIAEDCYEHRYHTEEEDRCKHMYNSVVCAIKKLSKMVD